MTDNHPNNEKFAPPSVEDEEAAWILLSLKGNNIIDTSNTMSPNTEATQQAAEVRILEHAMVQGAPPIPIPASTNGTPFRLVISSGEQAVQERKASPKPFTNRLSSDVATTSREAQKGIRECVIFSLDRTILAGRADSNLGQKGRKVVVNRARRATNVSIGGQNDAVDIDSNTVFNNAISSRTRAGKLLPNRSNDNSPNTQQRGNAPTMAAAAGPVSLHAESFPLGGGGNSAHKPSIDPFNGAQTITAQRFLQATANTATAGGGARRAHFNNPNELARFSAVVSFRQSCQRHIANLSLRRHRSTTRTMPSSKETVLPQHFHLINHTTLLLPPQASQIAAPSAQSTSIRPSVMSATRVISPSSIAATLAPRSSTVLA